MRPRVCGVGVRNCNQHVRGMVTASMHALRLGFCLHRWGRSAVYRIRKQARNQARGDGSPDEGFKSWDVYFTIMCWSTSTNILLPCPFRPLNNHGAAGCELSGMLTFLDFPYNHHFHYGSHSPVMATSQPPSQPPSQPTHNELRQLQLLCFGV